MSKAFCLIHKETAWMGMPAGLKGAPACEASNKFRFPSVRETHFAGDWPSNPRGFLGRQGLRIRRPSNATLALPGIPVGSSAGETYEWLRNHSGKRNNANLNQWNPSMCNRTNPKQDAYANCLRSMVYRSSLPNLQTAATRVKPSSCLHIYFYINTYCFFPTLDM